MIAKMEIVRFAHAQCRHLIRFYHSHLNANETLQICPIFDALVARTQLQIFNVAVKTMIATSQDIQCQHISADILLLTISESIEILDHICHISCIHSHRLLLINRLNDVFELVVFTQISRFVVLVL